MIDLAELTKLKGKRLDLRFADGFVVRARLLSVDPDSLGAELIYDIEKVLDWGSIPPSSSRPGAAAAARAADVAGWTALD